MNRREVLAVSAAAMALLPLRELQAQTTPTTPGSSGSSAPPGAAPAAGPKLTNAQLDQLMAPVALYPDGLLAQVTMAATYPLEVVEAARWSKDNPNLKGDAAVQACKDKGWDPSVQSLVAFPQILAMMNGKLDWTIKVGNAMLAQQSDVAGSVQRLRKQAQDAGNLKSTPQQAVKMQPPSAGAPADTPPAIVIEPVDEKTVYVPTYNPQYVYGTWPYPESPPTYFPPPAYYGVGPGWLGGLAFGLGIGIGVGFFGGWGWGGGWGGGWGWGGWGGWGGGNSYTTINRNITHINNNYHYDPNRNHWNHDPSHRHGVHTPGHPHRPGGPGHSRGEHHAFNGHPRTEPIQRGTPRTTGPVERGREGGGREGAGREGDRTPRTEPIQRGTPRTADPVRREGDRGHQGYQNRGRGLSGIERGRQVNREADRGHSYHRQAHANYHHAAYHPHPHVAQHHGGGGRRR